MAMLTLFTLFGFLITSFGKEVTREIRTVSFMSPAQYWTPSVSFPPWTQNNPHLFVPAKQPQYQPRPSVAEEDDYQEIEEDPLGPLPPRDYFPPPNIVKLLEDEKASTLLGLLEQADLLERLQRKGNLTLFAPTNAAFEKLGQQTLKTLADDHNLLKSVLEYHIVPDGKIFTHVLKDDLLAETLLANRSLRFNVHADLLTVNGAAISSAKRDQRASNGVVHFLDLVVYPVPRGSILEVLGDDIRFVTLVRAIEVADLSKMLRDESGPFTLFAPTDEAFDLVPRETLSTLLADKDALRKLLLRHMVKGTKLSAALTFVDLVSLASGEHLDVQTRKGKVFVRDAVIVDGDVVATNGAVQVIDKVLL